MSPGEILDLVAPHRRRNETLVVCVQEEGGVPMATFRLSVNGTHSQWSSRLEDLERFEADAGQKIAERIVRGLRGRKG